jgi:hypothetical protein
MHSLAIYQTFIAPHGRFAVVSARDICGFRKQRLRISGTRNSFVRAMAEPPQCLWRNVGEVGSLRFRLETPTTLYTGLGPRNTACVLFIVIDRTSILIRQPRTGCKVPLCIWQAARDYSFKAFGTHVMSIRKGSPMRRWLVAPDSTDAPCSVA